MIQDDEPGVPQLRLGGGTLPGEESPERRSAPGRCSVRSSTSQVSQASSTGGESHASTCSFVSLEGLTHKSEFDFASLVAQGQVLPAWEVVRREKDSHCVSDGEPIYEAKVFGQDSDTDDLLDESQVASYGGSSKRSSLGSAGVAVGSFLANGDELSPLMEAQLATEPTLGMISAEDLRRLQAESNDARERCNTDDTVVATSQTGPMPSSPLAQQAAAASPTRAPPQERPFLTTPEPLAQDRSPAISPLTALALELASDNSSSDPASPPRTDHSETGCDEGLEVEAAVEAEAAVLGDAPPTSLDGAHAPGESGPTKAAAEDGEATPRPTVDGVEAQGLEDIGEQKREEEAPALPPPPAVTEAEPIPAVLVEPPHAERRSPPDDQSGAAPATSPGDRELDAWKQAMLEVISAQQNQIDCLNKETRRLNTQLARYEERFELMEDTVEAAVATMREVNDNVVAAQQTARTALAKAQITTELSPSSALNLRAASPPATQFSRQASPVNPIESQDILIGRCVGYMGKAGVKSKKRWYAIREDGILLSYKNAQSAAPANATMIDLTGYQIQATSDAFKAYGFRAVHSRLKMYSWVVDTHDDRARWMTGLAAAINRLGSCA